MTDIKQLVSLQKHSNMSFFSFLSDNYELSQFVLSKKEPVNAIIKNRYQTA